MAEIFRLHENKSLELVQDQKRQEAVVSNIVLECRLQMVDAVIGRANRQCIFARKVVWQTIVIDHRCYQNDIAIAQETENISFDLLIRNDAALEGLT